MSIAESTASTVTFTLSSAFKSIAPLPEHGVPELPAALELPTASVTLVRGPLPSQVRLLPAAAGEMREHRDLYQRSLGELAPPSNEVVQLMGLVSGWASQARLARVYVRFADAQMKTAWTLLRTHLEAIRPSLEVAAKRDATVETAFKALLDLGRARSQAGKRGAATRRAIKDGTAEKRAAQRIVKKRGQQHELEAKAAKARALADLMEAEVKAEEAKESTSHASNPMPVAGGPTPGHA